VRPALLIPFVAACGGGGGGQPDGDLVVTSSFTLIAISGESPSPLDPYVDQVVSFALTFANAATDDETIGSCDRHMTSAAATGVATGATKDIVTSYILGRIPTWQATLELCDVTAESSASIFADNEAGLGVSIGCLDLPASAIARGDDGLPAWTAFEPTRCDGTVYDESNGRVFGTAAFTMSFGF
jgi:hypothetical protein